MTQYFDAPILTRREEKKTRAGHHLMFRQYAEVSSDEDFDDPHLQHDQDMARDVALRLQAYYPGHFWATCWSTRQGIAWISIPVLLGERWKYVEKIANLKTEHDVSRFAMKAGGEILERFQIPRSTFKLDAFLDARQSAVFRNRVPPGGIIRKKNAF